MGLITLFLITDWKRLALALWLVCSAASQPESEAPQRGSKWNPFIILGITVAAGVAILGSFKLAMMIKEFLMQWRLMR